VGTVLTGADVAIWPGALLLAAPAVVEADDPLSEPQPAVITAANNVGTTSRRQGVAIHGDARSRAAKLDGR
jgi:hypothetical protein